MTAITLIENVPAELLEVVKQIHEFAQGVENKTPTFTAEGYEVTLTPMPEKGTSIHFYKLAESPHPFVEMNTESSVIQVFGNDSGKPSDVDMASIFAALKIVAWFTGQRINGCRSSLRVKVYGEPPVEILEVANKINDIIRGLKPKNNVFIVEDHTAVVNAYGPRTVIHLYDFGRSCQCLAQIKNDYDKVVSYQMQGRVDEEAYLSIDTILGVMQKLYPLVQVRLQEKQAAVQ